MSYLVIARKFRPQDFSSVIGQEHITLALANSILRNRVPHALLFTGPRGVGKTTSARVLARALNCTGNAASLEAPENASPQTAAEAAALVEPCGECTNCIEIARSTSMAVWEIDGASHNSVEDMRALIESLRSLPPPGSKYKIYLIDEVHMLSIAAFNALLKSLEEPPPNTIFIFATTEPHKIPDTVISRCQRHDFRRLPTDLIETSLKDIAKKEGIVADEDVFTFVARRSQGGMRDAQSMLDRLAAFGNARMDLTTAEQIFGVSDARFFFRLGDAVLGGNHQESFFLLDEAFKRSIDIRGFVADFLVYWRNLLIASYSQKDESTRKLLELTKEEYEWLLRQIPKVSSFDLQRLFDLAQQTAELALRSPHSRFAIEAGVAKMAALPDLMPLAEVVSEIKSVVSGKGSGGTGGSGGGYVKPEKISPIKSEPLESDASEIDREIVNFNPSWQAFIAHAKARGVRMLEAYLKRVSPKQFVISEESEKVIGQMAIEGNAFEINAIKDPEVMKSLRECLISYSGTSIWDIKLSESKLESLTREITEEKREVVQANTQQARPAPKDTGPALGSIAAQEKQEENERRDQVKSEAKQDAVVQAALSAFKGSKIEKISVLE